MVCSNRPVFPLRKRKWSELVDSDSGWFSRTMDYIFDSASALVSGVLWKWYDAINVTDSKNHSGFKRQVKLKTLTGEESDKHSIEEGIVADVLPYHFFKNNTDSTGQKPSEILDLPIKPPFFRNQYTPHGRSPPSYLWPYLASNSKDGLAYDLASSSLGSLKGSYFSNKQAKKRGRSMLENDTESYDPWVRSTSQKFSMISRSHREFSSKRVDDLLQAPKTKGSHYCDIASNFPTVLRKGKLKRGSQPQATFSSSTAQTSECKSSKKLFINNNYGRVASLVSSSNEKSMHKPLNSSLTNGMTSRPLLKIWNDADKASNKPDATKRKGGDLATPWHSRSFFSSFPTHLKMNFKYDTRNNI